MGQADVTWRTERSVFRGARRPAVGQVGVIRGTLSGRGAGGWDVGPVGCAVWVQTRNLALLGTPGPAAPQQGPGRGGGKAAPRCHGDGAPTQQNIFVPPRDKNSSLNT